MSKDDELVLGFPRAVLDELGSFQGYRHGLNNEAGASYLERILSAEVASFRRRGDCETDPSWKQIIPYIAFQHVSVFGQTHVMRYSRTKVSGENRLHGKLSIGIGGHINPLDGAVCLTNFSFRDTFEQGWRRELLEEVVIDADYTASPIGMINTDEDEVGQVHFGILMLVQVSLPCVYPNEPAIGQVHFVPLPSISRPASPIFGEFETWSQAVLRSPMAFAR